MCWVENQTGPNSRFDVYHNLCSPQSMHAVHVHWALLSKPSLAIQDFCYFCAVITVIGKRLRLAQRGLPSQGEKAARVSVIHLALWSSWLFFLHYLSSLLSYYETIEACNCLLLLYDFGQSSIGNIYWRDVKDGVVLNWRSCYLPNLVKPEEFSVIYIQIALL